LGEGIHAACGSHRGWAAKRECGIKKSADRGEVVVTEGLLEPSCSDSAQHGILGGFTACTCRGWRCDQRQGCARMISVADPFQVGGHRLGKRHHGGNRFGTVDHTASADGDHHVQWAVPEFSNSAVNEIGGRLALDRESVEGDRRIRQAAGDLVPISGALQRP